MKPDRGLAAGIVLAVLIGAGMAIQSRVNGELGTRLHDGIAAAALSVGGGLVLLALLVPALPAGRRGLAALRTALRDGKLRWWQCTGGMCGALYVSHRKKGWDLGARRSTKSTALPVSTSSR